MLCYSLPKKIPNVEGESPESYVKHNPHSIFLKPTDTNDITTVVHALTRGPDGPVAQLSIDKS